MIRIDKNLHHSQQTTLFSKLKKKVIFSFEKNKTQGSVNAMRLNSHFALSKRFSSVLHQTTVFI